MPIASKITSEQWIEWGTKIYESSAFCFVADRGQHEHRMNSTPVNPL
jgi:hypothetical protein